MAGNGFEEYSMVNKFRGYAMIIANETFAGDTTNRPAARSDIKMMTALFRSLDFHVTYFMDQKADDMRKHIEQVSKYEGNKDADCFVLVISSHGELVPISETGAEADTWRQTIKGVDNRCIYVDEILKLFDDKVNKDSELKDKPKLFFLQVCRSRLNRDGILETFDKGKNIKVSFTDATPSIEQPSDAYFHDDKFINLVTKEFQALYKVDSNSIPINEKPISQEEHQLAKEISKLNTTKASFDMEPIACPNDCLVMYPVAAGTIAVSGMRSEHSEILQFSNLSERKDAYKIDGIGFGTYMINFMFHESCRNLLLQEKADILQYLTSVNTKMASIDIEFDPRSVTNKPQDIEILTNNMPFRVTGCLYHKLRKILKFHPKTEKSLWKILKTKQAF